MNKQTIKDWAVDDRPREKLINKGVETLSNSELIAILILNGAVNKSCIAYLYLRGLSTGYEPQRKNFLRHRFSACCY